MNQDEDNTYKNYLFDLGYYIKERALQSKEERNKEAKNTSRYQFECGRLLAFNEVISIMQQQAIGFGIPIKELQLEDIEPDRDLI